MYINVNTKLYTCTGQEMPFDVHLTFSYETCRLFSFVVEQNSNITHASNSP